MKIDELDFKLSQIGEKGLIKHLFISIIGGVIFRWFFKEQDISGISIFVFMASYILFLAVQLMRDNKKFLKEKIQQLYDDVLSKIEEIEMLKEKCKIIGNLEVKIQTLIGEKEKIFNANESLVKDNEMLQTKIKTLQESLSERESRLQSLDKINSDLTVQLEAIQVEMKSVKAKIGGYTRTIKQKDEFISQLQSKQKKKKHDKQEQD